MKTFKQYLQEHNPFATKSIIKKLNPLDKEMAKLKKMRKQGITGMAKEKLMKKIGVMRPSTATTNKLRDKLKDEKEKRKADKEKLEAQTKKINDLENQLHRPGQ